MNTASSGEQTIGEAGQQGFGVGVYGGEISDLTAISLSPMDGCEDIASDNYGNYIHSNGSVMVFIPAFCYRVGNAAAPSYSRDGTNALEIKSATEFPGFNPGSAYSSADMGDGWVLHRAFVDGGLVKRGFFIDKYLCSKDSSGQVAVSVKNGNPISLYTSNIPSSTMPNCTGIIADAITLSRARGEGYSCVSCFQWSAISMLSLAHGQAATSADYCAWYDSGHTTNFPKGCNSALKDINDTSVTFTKAEGNYSYSGNDTALTGSASNFAKTTHNGQNSGITDVNGNKYQPLLGWQRPANKQLKFYGPHVKLHDVTADTRTSASYLTVSAVSDQADSWNVYYWGQNAFFSDASDSEWSMCGVLPKETKSSVSNLFGGNYIWQYSGADVVLFAAGYCGGGSVAGVWSRFGDIVGWGNGFLGSRGFRASGYAQ